MAATLKDIAEEAGFSIGTVSKVLNARRGADAFSKECVQAIRKAARKLGYRPNYHARSLQGGRSQTIGVLMGHLDQCSWDHFWAQMIGGIMVRARTMGYHSLTVGEVREADPLDLGLRFLQERRIDALIVPPYVAVDDPCEFEKLPGPVVRADYTAGSDWPTVALGRRTPWTRPWGAAGAPFATQWPSWAWRANW
jgi:DNA-binding LacI/PurR family transcriptional regulator